MDGVNHHRPGPEADATRRRRSGGNDDPLFHPPDQVFRRHRPSVEQALGGIAAEITQYRVQSHGLYAFGK